MIFNPGIMAAAGGGGGAVVKSYIGDGTTSRTINLPFTPAFLIVFSLSNIAFIQGNVCVIFGVKSIATTLNSTTKSGLATLNSSISRGILDLSGNISKFLNSSDEGYSYVAFPKA